MRLHPRAGGDIFDLALAGKLAAVESLEEDDEGRVHVTVTLDDDPGRDLGAARVLGHRFFFRLDEIEPVEGGDEQAASAGTRILVAGVGNIFLGDDGFGVAVANRLAERELPEGVDVRDFGIRGMDLAYALQDGYDAVVFVDAAPRGEAPGTLSVIEPVLDLDEVVLDTHGMDPLRVIALARALGGIPPRVLVVACEPETVVHGEHDEELVGELRRYDSEEAPRNHLSPYRGDPRAGRPVAAPLPEDREDVAVHRTKVRIVEGVLDANDTIARANRADFDDAGVTVVNLMSAPGAGKTSLLERTVRNLEGIRIGVLEGDVQGSLDADRLASLHVPVTQINTDPGFGGECHLDANMVRSAIPSIPLEELDLLVIENVGNLVCPAEFRVGEHHRVMISSVTEGEDKPLKYPLMFRACELVLVNKIDLVPHLDFDLGKLLANVEAVHPGMPTALVSARTGEGVEEWRRWLVQAVGRVAQPA